MSQLLAFVTAVETGSFSAAGRKLGKTQAAISTAVSNLENELGLVLFDRSARDPVLNDAGVKLFQESRFILKRCQSLSAMARELSGEEEKSFTLCISSMLPLPELSPLFHALNDTYPNTTLCIREDRDDWVVQQIRKGEADLGISTIIDEPLADLATQPLFECAFSFLCSPDHPLAVQQQEQKHPLSREDLGRYRQIVIYQDPVLYDYWLFSSQYWEADTTRTLISMAASGCGWTALATPTIQAQIASGSLVELTVEPALQFQLRVVMLWDPRKGNALVNQLLRQQLLEMYK